MANRATLLLILLLCCINLSACVQKMGEDGHLRTYVGNRVPPVGTISREQALGPSQSPQANPMPITQMLLNRGRERFNIYCSPCHDFTGSGNGMIVQRGFLAPPSYHTDRMRKAPDAHFFDVISNGYGAMYSYADRVSPSDRWAIVAYIRALQLSQNATRSLLRPDELKHLQEKNQ